METLFTIGKKKKLEAAPVSISRYMDKQNKIFTFKTHMLRARVALGSKWIMTTQLYYWFNSFMNLKFDEIIGR